MTQKYCKYKGRFVILNEFNKDCWCALYCAIKKICTATACQTHVRRDLTPDLQRNCRNCIRTTNSLRRNAALQQQKQK